MNTHDKPSQPVNSHENSLDDYTTQSPVPSNELKTDINSQTDKFLFSLDSHPNLTADQTEQRSTSELNNLSNNSGDEPDPQSQDSPDNRPDDTPDTRTARGTEIRHHTRSQGPPTDHPWILKKKI